MDVSAIATVQTVVGNVVAVNAEGITRMLTSGDTLFQGEVLKTDFNASASIAYVDGSHQTLGENTHLTLNQPPSESAHFADDTSFLPSDTGSGATIGNFIQEDSDRSNAIFNFYNAEVTSVITTDSNSAGDDQLRLQTLTYSSLLGTGSTLAGLVPTTTDTGNQTSSSASTADSIMHLSLSEGNVLNLSSLLPGVSADNLQNHLSVTSSGDDTVLNIHVEGSNPQQIVLQDINASDLTGTSEPSSADVISQLLSTRLLVV